MRRARHVASRQRWSILSRYPAAARRMFHIQRVHEQTTEPLFNLGTFDSYHAAKVRLLAWLTHTYECIGEGPDENRFWGCNKGQPADHYIIAR